MNWASLKIKMKNEVIIYYSLAPDKIIAENLKIATPALPDSIRHNFLKYYNHKDQYLSLLGWLMIEKSIRHFDLPAQTITEITTNTFGKPIHPQFNFNYAHSGNLIVCAASKNLQIGIDIELIKKIDLQEYKSILNRDKIDQIKNETDFFHYWCKMESIIKADGRGMEIDFNKIVEQNNMAVIENEKTNWYLKEIKTEPHYVSYICTDGKAEISIKRIDF